MQVLHRPRCFVLPHAQTQQGSSLTLNLKAFHVSFLILSIIMLSSILTFRQLRVEDGAKMLNLYKK